MELVEWKNSAQFEEQPEKAEKRNPGSTGFVQNAWMFQKWMYAKMIGLLQSSHNLQMGVIAQLPFASEPQKQTRNWQFIAQQRIKNKMQCKADLGQKGFFIRQKSQRWEGNLTLRRCKLPISVGLCLLADCCTSAHQVQQLRESEGGGGNECQLRDCWPLDLLGSEAINLVRMRPKMTLWKMLIWRWNGQVVSFLRGTPQKKRYVLTGKKYCTIKNKPKNV